MSGEFLTEYSAETVERARSSIDRKIHQAGSLSDYLLALQVEQAQTSDGRAELRRLKRVGAMITSPLAGAETPEAEAFYNGALLSSALLSELTNPKKFQGGTFAHNYFWYYYQQELLARDESLGELERQGVIGRLSEDLQFDAYTTATADEDDSLNTFRDFADEHLYTLYSRDEDLFTDAQIGFWVPVKEVYEPAFMHDTAPLLRHFPAPETAHETPEYIPSLERVEDIVGEPIVLPRLHPIKKEREKIMKHFNDLRAGFGSLEAYAPDETARLAMVQYQERQLNSLNYQNEFIAPGDLVQVTGPYHCTVKDGIDGPLPIKMNHSTEVVGEFDSIIIIEVPSIRHFNIGDHPAGKGNPLYAVEKVPTPALLLRDPTFIETYSAEEEGEGGHQTVRYTEDTTIAVPLLYKSARIARAL